MRRESDLPGKDAKAFEPSIRPSRRQFNETKLDVRIFPLAKIVLSQDRKRKQQRFTTYVLIFQPKAISFCGIKISWVLRWIYSGYPRTMLDPY